MVRYAVESELPDTTAVHRVAARKLLLVKAILQDLEANAALILRIRC